MPKHKTINEFEEDSSTNESVTLFEEHGKPSHEVDPPAPIQQIQQNIGQISEQELKMQFSIKQELLDAMYYNSENQQGQLLDTTETNILERGRAFTQENHDSSIKIKTEKDASVIVKDDSKKIPAVELKQELNNDTYFRKLDKSNEAQTSSEDLTFGSLSMINDPEKLDSQKYNNIMHELLACEYVPLPRKLRLNSTLKRDSMFNEGELSSISSDFTSDNSISLLDTGTEKNCIPESRNSNLHHLLSSDTLTNDTGDMLNGSALSDLQNLEPMVAPSNEQIHVSSIEHLKNNITTSSKNIHTEVCQDVRVINEEVMSNISNICLDHSSPSLSSTCSSFDDNSNVCFKTSRKMKEAAIDTEINSSMSGSIVFDNSMLSNENFQHGGNQTSTYSDVFVHSWGHVDSSNSEKGFADVSVFSELGTHLRLLGYQLHKSKDIKTFGKEAFKEHENNKKLTIDHLFLEKFFPTEEVPETSEENKLEEKLAKFCLPKSTVEVNCKTQNLENEIAQTGLQNANSWFEPEVEKITHVDLQDADSNFEPIVKKIAQMDSQDENSYIDHEAEKRDITSEEIFRLLHVQALKDILKNFQNNPTDNLKDSTCKTKSCSESSLTLTENNPSSTQSVSSSVFDGDEANKHSPSNTNQLHNTGHNLQEDSDDSFVDNSRAEDSDANVKNLSFEEKLNPELPPKKTQKKKSDSKDSEFVPRKKSRYEIIMERKEQEKSLKLENHGVKEKSVSLHNKSSQLSSNSKQIENKLEEKLAKFCLPKSTVEVNCKPQNLENEIAQTGLQNANSCFEPEVEKITHMDLQDTDSNFEPIVKKIAQMDSQDENSYIDHEAEKRDMTREEIFRLLHVQALKDILKKFQNNSTDNLKDSTCKTKSCSESSLTLIENNPSSTQSVSSSVFDGDEANKHSPSNADQLHNTGHSLQEDSDDSCVDNSRAEDSDATVKNLSVEEQLNPECPPKKPQKKKSDSNKDVEFVPRKKSRYEIIMERKEQEKSLKEANHGVKEKSVSLHSKSSQLSTNSKEHKGLENFHPTPGKSPSLQKKKIPKSKKDDTSKGKAKLVTEKTKMDAHEKKKRDERSSHSGFSDMDAGIRFVNRNSSLFEDIVKISQQPRKNAKSNTSLLSMEEIHAQIDINLNSVSEPQKKKLSVADYFSRNKALSSPPVNRDALHTESRALPPSIQSFLARPLIQDPRLTRRQSVDSSPNLKYIRSYQPNTMIQSENVLQFNNSTQTSSSFSPPNSDYNIWNNSLSEENHVSLTMGPVSEPMNAYLLHSNRNSPPTISLLSPSQTSCDDTDLCDSESPIPPQIVSPDQFHSSRKTQNFESISSAASSSYLREPSLLSTMSYYPRFASAMMTSSNLNLPGPRSEDSSYDSNVLPLQLSQCVGQTVMSAPEALTVILSWVPDWLKEVDRSNKKETPPLWRNATALKETRLCYKNVIDYFTTVFPLMLLDLFFRMCEMHESMMEKNSNTYVLDFVKSQIVDNMVEIDAEIVLSARKPHSTMKGQLAVLTFALKSGKKKDVFGFISNQYSYLNNAIGQEVLHLRIKLVHDVQRFNKKEKISIFPFYPLSKFLAQIDALVYIDISPLRNILLKPSAPACTRIVLERFGSLAGNVHIVNHAIEKIKDGISLNEPEEPRILIIDSPLGTDLMFTLIGVIEDVKKSETPSEKQPILICTRTMKQLVNISLRLLPTDGKGSACPVLNTTILVKVNRISEPKLKELTLEYKVTDCKMSARRQSGTSLERLPEELVLKEAKTKILKDSDVVLSHIPQSYDNSLKMLFGSGKPLQFAFCIVDEAYTFTEPEVSLPLSYGVKKLILAGDSKEKPREVSEVSAKHKYYKPLPSRLSLYIDSLYQ